MKFKQTLLKESDYPRAVSDDLVIQELKGELLIYNLITHKAFCLNETSALVWKACDGMKSVSEISREVSKNLKSPVDEDFIWLAIDGLKKDELLIENENIEITFNGLSRREMIRKVGLATAVALPIVSSLVAPAAAQAQSSGSGSGSGACTDNCSGLGSLCSCSSVSCPPGTTVGIGLNLGVCATVSVAASLGINVSAGTSGNVCLVTAACVRLPI